MSYNVYPGCHVRQAVWEMLHHHVDHIEDPQARLTAARELAGILAEPSVAQSETDGLLRQELARVATQTDSALFHDDLAIFNEPVISAISPPTSRAHDLAYLGEAKLSTMTAAGLTPRVQQLVARMDRLQREQYLDFARLRRFRQSLACRADAEPSDGGTRSAGARHARGRGACRWWPSFATRASSRTRRRPGDVSGHAIRRVLKWLAKEAPRVVPVTEAVAWLAATAPDEARGARPLPQLLAESHYAGLVDFYTVPPRLAATPGDRPLASAIVRWQKGPLLTSLRHETLRIDDATALALLNLMDGTRTRAELAARSAPLLPPQDRAKAAERVECTCRISRCSASCRASAAY